MFKLKPSLNTCCPVFPQVRLEEVVVGGDGPFGCGARDVLLLDVGGSCCLVLAFSINLVHLFMTFGGDWISSRSTTVSLVEGNRRRCDTNRI